MMYNVILITLDCVRPDYLSCYNPQAKTETHFFKKIADKYCQTFMQAISSFGGTPISIASFLSGTTPMTNQCVMIGEEYINPLSDSYKSIASILKENGYNTFGISSVPLLSKELGFAQSFDYFEMVDGTQKIRQRNLAEKVTDKAITLIKRIKKPWFAWLHYFDAHMPYYPPEPFSAKYASNPYTGEIIYLEHQLSKLFSLINFDNTLVVISSDHGESFGEHGIFFHGNFYDENLRVPLLISIPNSRPARNNNLVRTIDIMPTILDVLNIKVDDIIEGVSLLPMVKDSSLKLISEAYCGLMLSNGIIYAAIRTEDYKLIIDNYSPIAYKNQLLQRILRILKPRSDTLARHVRDFFHKKSIKKYGERKLFFDLKNDPQERLNLLGTLEPYVTGIGRVVCIRDAFLTIDWDKYQMIAQTLEVKLRRYLQKNISVGMKHSENEEIIKQLKNLGYIE